MSEREPGAADGEPSAAGPTLNGLLAVYQDDQLDQCVRSALKRKSRVKYRCMDAFANFLAFGTTAGAIYLFRLKSVTHSSCSLAAMIPCNQGSIEAIRFLPTSNATSPLVAIGTAQGSLVLFRLVQQPDEQTLACNELYRAECFTNNSRIKLLEFDRDPTGDSFAKLYVCDATNRLYSLDKSSIYAYQQTLRLFKSDKPALIFSVEGSNINQISVHRSQLLISTDETTRYLNEATNQTQTIGKKKRREGFFGACFLNLSNPKQQQQTGSRQTVYSSTNSVNELENVLIFVARPNFRLWQVSNKLEVMFTHQFEPLLKLTPPNKVIELRNEFEIDSEAAAAGGESMSDAVNMVSDVFASVNGADGATFADASGDYQTRAKVAPDAGEGAPTAAPRLAGNNFEKLIPICSNTLGSLLLSYTRRELYVVDPVGAKLIVWCRLPCAEIIQVCCNENEIFVWSSLGAETSSAQQQQQPHRFQVQRLVLLAPTQLVLELHRTQRHLSLALFVQMFSEQFKRIMALPLSGPGIITTEGGLLRNVLLNAWSCLESRAAAAATDEAEDLSACIGERCKTFRRIINQIVDESRQLKQSLEDLTDSRFFLAMTAENIDRLCCEPYTSLVSLDVSIANLHTNHVIHFSQAALNRHKSLMNLPQSLKNMPRPTRKIAQSTCDISSGGNGGRRVAVNGIGLRNRRESGHNENGGGGDDHDDDDNANSRDGGHKSSLSEVLNRGANEADVIVERHYYPSSRRAKPLAEVPESGVQKQTTTTTRTIVKSSDGSFFSRLETIEALDTQSKTGLIEEEEEEDDVARVDENSTGGKLATGEPHRPIDKRLDLRECINNRDWTRPRAHLNPMYSSQQIQFKWIQENLMAKFEENVDEIEAQALKHGLWHLLLKCLAFRQRLDDFIDCCIMLDDIRLFNLKHFVDDENGLGEEQIIGRLFERLEQKLEYVNYDDEISFNLVNLFEQFIMRRDIKRYIQHLLKFPRLVDESRIPASFYLKAVASSALSFSSGGYNFGN